MKRLCGFSQGVVPAAILVCFGVTGVQAASWTLSGGKYSAATGALHETFDSLAVDSKETVDLSWSGTGGAIYSAGGDLVFQPGTIGNFLVVGGTKKKPGTVTIDLSASPVKYYGFRWGSIDKYNTVSFFDGVNLLFSLAGTTVKDMNPDRFSGYLNVRAGAGEAISKVVMVSTWHSFETDNHSVLFPSPSRAPTGMSLATSASAVPEPATSVILLCGLGLVGFATARRRSALLSER